ncbi:MAG: HEAT repeat domain-containing protein [Candidatus Omnitrophota bacterium]
MTQIDLMEDKQLKEEALLNFAGYYRFKADSLTEDERPPVWDTAGDLYREVLEIDPFSLEALKGLIAVRVTEAEMVLKVWEVLKNPELSQKDNDYKTALVSFVADNRGRWAKAGRRLSISPEIVKNFGDVSPEAAGRLIDLFFREKRYDLVSEILKKTYTHTSGYIAVIDALNRDLVSLRISELEFEKDQAGAITGQLGILGEKSFDGREMEKRILKTGILLARIYLEIGQGRYSAAESALDTVETTDGYMKSAAALARIKLRITKGQRYRFFLPGSRRWITRHLTDADKKIAERDLSQAYRQKAEGEREKPSTPPPEKPSAPSPPPIADITSETGAASPALIAVLGGTGAIFTLVNSVAGPYIASLALGAGILAWLALRGMRSDKKWFRTAVIGLVLASMLAGPMVGTGISAGIHSSITAAQEINKVGGQEDLETIFGYRGSLHHIDEEVRLATAEWIGEKGRGREAFEMLVKGKLAGIYDVMSARVRVKSLEAIEKLAQRGAIDRGDRELLDILAGQKGGGMRDPEAMVRQAAIWVIARISGMEALDIFQRTGIGIHDKDMGVRMFTFDMIVDIAGKEAVHILTKPGVGINDDKIEARIYAIENIFQIEGLKKSDIDFLKEFAASKMKDREMISREIGIMVYRHLNKWGHIDDGEAIRFFEKLSREVENNAPTERLTAMAAIKTLMGLEHISKREAIDILSREGQGINDTDIECQLKAIETVCSITGPEDADVIQKMLTVLVERLDSEKSDFLLREKVFENFHRLAATLPTDHPLYVLAQRKMEIMSGSLSVKDMMRIFESQVFLSRTDGLDVHDRFSMARSIEVVLKRFDIPILPETVNATGDLTAFFMEKGQAFGENILMDKNTNLRMVFYPDFAGEQNTILSIAQKCEIEYMAKGNSQVSSIVGSPGWEVNASMKDSILNLIKGASRDSLKMTPEKTVLWLALHGTPGDIMFSGPSEFDAPRGKSDEKIRRFSRISYEEMVDNGFMQAIVESGKKHFNLSQMVIMVDTCHAKAFWTNVINDLYKKCEEANPVIEVRGLPTIIVTTDRASVGYAGVFLDKLSDGFLESGETQLRGAHIREVAKELLKPVATFEDATSASQDLNVISSLSPGDHSQLLGIIAGIKNKFPSGGPEVVSKKAGSRELKYKIQNPDGSIKIVDVPPECIVSPINELYLAEEVPVMGHLMGKFEEIETLDFKNGKLTGKLRHVETGEVLDLSEMKQEKVIGDDRQRFLQSIKEIIEKIDSKLFRNYLLNKLDTLPAQIVLTEGGLDGFFGTGRTNFLAIDKKLSKHPAAGFHEFMEYLSQADSEVLDWLEGLLNDTGRLWLEEHEDEYRQRDMLKYFVENRPHYVIRAFTRQAFPEEDMKLTEMIKLAQKVAVIGIVGNEEKVRELNSGREYPDIHFVSAEKGKKGEEYLTALKGAPVTRLLVDLTELNDVSINSVVALARKQSFMTMEPYLAGMDAGSISNLDTPEIKTAMRTIKDSIPDEMPMDDILGSLFEAYKSGVQADTSLSAGITPEDEEAWVRENVRSLKDYKEARDKRLPREDHERRKLLGLHVKLDEYMRDKSRDESRAVMIRHQGIAIAQSLEEEIMELRNTFVDKGVIPKGAQQAIVIDAREEAGFSVDLMVPSLLTLAKLPDLRICVITDRAGGLTEVMNKAVPGTAKPANITELSGVEANIIESVQAHFERRDVKIPLQGISITTGESLQDEIALVMRHITDTKGTDDSANFIIAGRPDNDEVAERVNRIIPAIAVMNLLKRAVSSIKESSVVTVACSEETVTGFKKVLKTLLEITKLKIGETLRTFIDSLRATARSV